MGPITEGFVFFLLGTMVSVALYFISRQRKRLTLTYEKTTLYTRLHPDITITYQGMAVENLSRLRALLWNSGTQAIRRDDIPSGFEPTITVEGARLRSAAIRASSPSIGCELLPNADESVAQVAIVFDFLNPQDYVAIDVLYEKSKAKTHVEFGARIIGGLPANKTRFVYAPTPFSWVPSLFFVLLSPPLIYLVTRMMPTLREASGKEDGWGAAVLVSVVVLYLFATLMNLISDVRRWRLHGLPKRLREIFLA